MWIDWCKTRKQARGRQQGEGSEERTRELNFEAEGLGKKVCTVPQARRVGAAFRTRGQWHQVRILQEIIWLESEL